MPRQPYDYHPPEQPPEDRGWGWWIVIAVAAVAVVAGIFIGWPAALAVVALTTLGFVLRRRVRRLNPRRWSYRSSR